MTASVLHRPVDTVALRVAMVASQLRTTGVADPRVVAAMAAIPRERFLPGVAPELAYRDQLTPLGRGREANLPMATGKLLTEAYLSAADRVLLIGAAGGLRRGGARPDRCPGRRGRDRRRARGARARGARRRAEGHGGRGSALHGVPRAGTVRRAIRRRRGRGVAGGALVAGRGQRPDRHRHRRPRRDPARLRASARQGGLGLTHFADVACPILPGFAKPVRFQVLIVRRSVSVRGGDRPRRRCARVRRDAARGAAQGVPVQPDDHRQPRRPARDRRERPDRARRRPPLGPGDRQPQREPGQHRQFVQQPRAQPDLAARRHGAGLQRRLGAQLGPRGRDPRRGGQGGAARDRGVALHRRGRRLQRRPPRRGDRRAQQPERPGPRHQPARQPGPVPGRRPDPHRCRPVGGAAQHRPRPAPDRAGEPDRQPRELRPAGRRRAGHSRRAAAAARAAGRRPTLRSRSRSATTRRCWPRSRRATPPPTTSTSPARRGCRRSGSRSGSTTTITSARLVPAATSAGSAGSASRVRPAASAST